MRVARAVAIGAVLALGACASRDQAGPPVAPDGAGMSHSLRSVSRAAMSRRHKLASQEAYDSGDFFEGVKEAEDDRDRRRRTEN